MTSTNIAFMRMTQTVLMTLMLLLPFPLFADGDFEFSEFDDAEFADDDFSDEEALLDEEALELEGVSVWDPLEPVNRGIFWFNDKAYRYVLKPIARGLRVVPKPVRKSGSNFFSNLLAPMRVINSLLQLKLKEAGTELARFGINTTIGVVGLFDPADKHFDIKRHSEDLGQTLGSYGLGHGLYLVIPILGPSSIRDGIGTLGDAAVDPLFYIFDDKDALAAKVFDSVNNLSLDNDTYESLTDDSIDPYATIRDAYLQSRKKSVEE
jgi:phospholipid-binding lipoprotein MlaA